MLENKALKQLVIVTRVLVVKAVDRVWSKNL